MRVNQDLEFDIIKSNFPYEILLLADETIDAINKYIFDSVVYGVNKNDKMIATFCLLRVDETTIEIKNIAVVDEFRNKGVGSEIIRYVKKICKDTYSTITVGTADNGINQIRFYERNGFEKYDTITNFFIENYPDPIYENGIRLKDMILLKFQETTVH